MRAFAVTLAVVGVLSLAAVASAASEPFVRFTNLPPGWQATATYALSWKY